MPTVLLQAQGNGELCPTRLSAWGSGPFLGAGVHPLPLQLPDGVSCGKSAV